MIRSLDSDLNCWEKPGSAEPSLKHLKRQIYQLVPARGMVKHAQLCDTVLIFRRSLAVQNRTAFKDDTIIPFDRRQSPVAAELQRGVCRAFRALGLSVVTELSLANGRRADVVALSHAGDITIIEIKSCLLDYQTDGKWQDYLPFCDRLYFAVTADFPCEVIPEGAGLILADRYGAELVREPLEERLSAARRKAMMLCFARAAALRLQLHLDPSCGFEV
jgi:hypothetical protein